MTPPIMNDKIAGSVDITGFATTLAAKLGRLLDSHEIPLAVKQAHQQWQHYWLPNGQIRLLGQEEINECKQSHTRGWPAFADHYTLEQHPHELSAVVLLFSLLKQLLTWNKKLPIDKQPYSLSIQKAISQFFNFNGLPLANYQQLAQIAIEVHRDETNHHLLSSPCSPLVYALIQAETTKGPTRKKYHGLLQTLYDNYSRQAQQPYTDLDNNTLILGVTKYGELFVYQQRQHRLALVTPQEGKQFRLNPQLIPVYTATKTSKPQRLNQYNHVPSPGLALSANDIYDLLVAQLEKDGQEGEWPNELTLDIVTELQQQLLQRFEQLLLALNKVNLENADNNLLAVLETIKENAKHVTATPHDASDDVHVEKTTERECDETLHDATDTIIEAYELLTDRVDSLSTEALETFATQHHEVIAALSEALSHWMLIIEATETSLTTSDNIKTQPQPDPEASLQLAPPAFELSELYAAMAEWLADLEQMTIQETLNSKPIHIEDESTPADISVPWYSSTAENESQPAKPIVFFTPVDAQQRQQTHDNNHNEQAPAANRTITQTSQCAFELFSSTEIPPAAAEAPAMEKQRTLGGEPKAILSH